MVLFSVSSYRANFHRLKSRPIHAHDKSISVCAVKDNKDNAEMFSCLYSLLRISHCVCVLCDGIEIDTNKCLDNCTVGHTLRVQAYVRSTLKRT